MNEQKMFYLLKSLKNINSVYGKILEKYELENCKDIQNIYLQLPFMNRKILREYGENIISSKFKEDLIIEMTTGTTGVPLRCPKSRDERSKLALALWKARFRIDSKVNPNNFLLLYGSSARKIGDFFDYNINNLNKCFEYINYIKPRWLCGSVSAFSIYAKEIENGNLIYNNSNLRYIEFQGEYVSSDTRKYIEKIFNAKTVVHYGNRESWTIAYECPYRKLHILDDIVYVENNQSGNIIITNYILNTLPIVKYNTEDLGEIIHYDCACGQKQYLNILDGRRSTIVEGTQINGNIFFKGVFNKVCKKDQNMIKQFRVVQTGIKAFNVFIVKGNNYSSDLEEIICYEIKSKMSDMVYIKIIYESEIYSTDTGKMPIFSINL